MDLEKHSLSPLAKAGDHESEHEEDVLVFAALKMWPTSTAEQMRTARENSTEAVAVFVATGRPGLMLNTWPLLVKITTHVEVKVATQSQFSGFCEISQVTSNKPPLKNFTQVTSNLKSCPVTGI